MISVLEGAAQRSAGFPGAGRVVPGCEATVEYSLLSRLGAFEVVCFDFGVSEVDVCDVCFGVALFEGDVIML